MDILDAIRTEIATLRDGDYLSGLQAVLIHVETATRHLQRGQKQSDDSAFTDAIYRTNQAFEGSIKEAYRVLAGKDPARVRPHDIEKYLEENEIFRPRILELLKNYRQSWRNPSTHDHKLDFDENEAFVAIVSVAAFAKLLVSEIGERIAFETARSQNIEIELKEKKLPQQIGEAAQAFVEYLPNSNDLKIENEAQLIGALAGFISKALPGAKITPEANVGRWDSRAIVDLLVEDGKQKVVIEVKNTTQSERAAAVGVRQLESYIRKSQADAGFLLVHAPGVTNYDIIRHGAQFPIWSLQPKKDRGS